MKKTVDNELLVRFLLHKSTEEENKKVLEWQEQDGDRAGYLDRLAQALARQKPLMSDAEELENGVRTVVARLRFRKMVRVSARVAAVVAGIAVASGLLFLRERKPESRDSLSELKVEMQTVNSPLGKVTKVVLSDSTRVWLAPASSLTFPKTFNGEKRDVSLNGQAYFEVTHINGKHFIVSSGLTQVEVLGTKFNVMAYPEEKSIRTTLVEGRVLFRVKTGNSMQKEVVLHPLERVSFNKNTDSLAVEPAAVEDDLAWKDSRMVFRYETFEEVIRRIELTRGVTIVVDSRVRPTIHFTGSFDKETVSEMLSSISRISPFSYTVKKDSVTIKPSPMK